jgi:hypothetical protein
MGSDSETDYEYDDDMDLDDDVDDDIEWNQGETTVITVTHNVINNDRFIDDDKEIINNMRNLLVIGDGTREQVIDSTSKMMLKSFRNVFNVSDQARFLKTLMNMASVGFYPVVQLHKKLDKRPEDEKNEMIYSHIHLVQKTEEFAIRRYNQTKSTHFNEKFIHWLYAPYGRDMVQDEFITLRPQDTIQAIYQWYQEDECIHEYIRLFDLDQLNIIGIAHVVNPHDAFETVELGKYLDFLINDVKVGETFFIEPYEPGVTPYNKVSKCKIVKKTSNHIVIELDSGESMLMHFSKTDIDVCIFKNKFALHKTRSLEGFSMRKFWSNNSIFLSTDVVLLYEKFLPTLEQWCFNTNKKLLSHIDLPDVYLNISSTNQVSDLIRQHINDIPEFRRTLYKQKQPVHKQRHRTLFLSFKSFPENVTDTTLARMFYLNAKQQKFTQQILKCCNDERELCEEELDMDDAKILDRFKKQNANFKHITSKVQRLHTYKPPDDTKLKLFSSLYSAFSQPPRQMNEQAIVLIPISKKKKPNKDDLIIVTFQCFGLSALQLQNSLTWRIDKFIAREFIENNGEGAELHEITNVIQAAGSGELQRFYLLEMISSYAKDIVQNKKSHLSEEEFDEFVDTFIVKLNNKYLKGVELQYVNTDPNETIEEEEELQDADDEPPPVDDNDEDQNVDGDADGDDKVASGNRHFEVLEKDSDNDEDDDEDENGNQIKISAKAREIFRKLVTISGLTLGKTRRVLLYRILAQYFQIDDIDLHIRKLQTNKRSAFMASTKNATPKERLVHENELQKETAFARKIHKDGRIKGFFLTIALMVIFTQSERPYQISLRPTGIHGNKFSLLGFPIEDESQLQLITYFAHIYHYAYQDSAIFPFIAEVEIEDMVKRIVFEIKDTLVKYSDLASAIEAARERVNEHATKVQENRKLMDLNYSFWPTYRPYHFSNKDIKLQGKGRTIQAALFIQRMHEILERQNKLKKDINDEPLYINSCCQDIYYNPFWNFEIFNDEQSLDPIVNATLNRVTIFLGPGRPQRISLISENYMQPPNKIRIIPSVEHEEEEDYQTLGMIVNNLQKCLYFDQDEFIERISDIDATNVDDVVRDLSAMATQKIQNISYLAPPFQPIVDKIIEKTVNNTELHQRSLIIDALRKTIVRDMLPYFSKRIHGYDAEVIGEYIDAKKYIQKPERDKLKELVCGIDNANSIPAIENEDLEEVLEELMDIPSDVVNEIAFYQEFNPDLIDDIPACKMYTLVYILCHALEHVCDIDTTFINFAVVQDVLLRADQNLEVALSFDRVSTEFEKQREDRKQELKTQDDGIEDESLKRTYQQMRRAGLGKFIPQRIQKKKKNVDTDMHDSKRTS